MVCLGCIACVRIHQNLDIFFANRLSGNQFYSQATIVSFNFSPQVTRLINSVDCNSQSPDSLQKVSVPVTLDNTVTSTILRHLVLCLKDLEQAEEATINRQPADMEQRQGRSNNLPSDAIEKVYDSCKKCLDAVAIRCGKGYTKELSIQIRTSSQLQEFRVELGKATVMGALCRKMDPKIATATKPQSRSEDTFPKLADDFVT